MFGRKREEAASSQEREDGLTDYDIYVMGKGEKVLNLLFAAAVLFGVGYVFYQNSNKTEKATRY